MLLRVLSIVLFFLAFIIAGSDTHTSAWFAPLSLIALGLTSFAASCFDYPLINRPVG